MPLDIKNVFVLTLGRANRKEQFERDFEAVKHLLPQPIYYPAIDGRLAIPPNGWIFRSKDYYRGPGAFGCYLTHLRIIEALLTNQIYTPTLILEDDAFPLDNFEDNFADNFKKLQDIRNWDMIFMGGEHLCEPIAQGDHLDLCTACNRSHAYLVQGKHFLQQYYSHATNWFLWHDNCYLDHAIMDFQVHGGYLIYATNPWLFGQREGFSDCLERNVPEQTWE